MAATLILLTHLWTWTVSPRLWILISVFNNMTGRYGDGQGITKAGQSLIP
jgi:hypothetical protein